MPQVDVVTFFPQVFWLVFLFISFYVFFLRDSATNLIVISKIRISYYLSNIIVSKYLQKNSYEKSLENHVIFMAILNNLLIINHLSLNEINDTWLKTNFKNVIQNDQAIMEFQNPRQSLILEESIFE